MTLTESAVVAAKIIGAIVAFLVAMIAAIIIVGGLDEIASRPPTRAAEVVGMIVAFAIFCGVFFAATTVFIWIVS